MSAQVLSKLGHSIGRSGILGAGLVCILLPLSNLYMDGDALLWDLAESAVPLVCGVVLLGLGIRLHRPTYRTQERLFVFAGGFGFSTFAIGLTLWRGILLSREGYSIPPVEYMQIVASGFALGFVFGSLFGLLLLRTYQLKSHLDQT